MGVTLWDGKNIVDPYMAVWWWIAKLVQDAIVFRNDPTNTAAFDKNQQEQDLSRQQVWGMMSRKVPLDTSSHNLSRETCPRYYKKQCIFFL